MFHSRIKHKFQLAQWLLAALLAFALGSHLWGLQRDLPFSPEVDEPTFVGLAVRMASSDDLNPGWFGNPGSTLIYPLVALYKWQPFTDRTLPAGPELQAKFDDDPTSFYILGRLLTSAFAVMCLPLFYKIGQLAFHSPYVGLIAGWFFTLYPIIVLRAKWVRTDSPSVFFTLLSLWLCLRFLKQPTLPKLMMAGLAIGLSLSTKYYLLPLVAVLLAANGLQVWHDRHQSHTLFKGLFTTSLGLLAVVVGFALTTPYFFLDFATARANLLFESRSTHPGGDGLSHLGNLYWYLTEALPQAISWFQMLLLVAGIGLVWHKRRPSQLLLLGYGVIFLAEISLLPLHWQRWLLPVLPIFSLLIAYAVREGATYLGKHLPIHESKRQMVLPALLLLISIIPLYTWALTNARLANGSTRVLAWKWITENLPAGSYIALEEYTADNLHKVGFNTLKGFSLASSGYSFDDYSNMRYEYLIVSSNIYDRFLVEPDRYPQEVAFYRNLFTNGSLLHQIEPSLTHGGATIRIYRLPG